MVGWIIWLYLWCVEEKIRFEREVEEAKESTEFKTEAYRQAVEKTKILSRAAERIGINPGVPGCSDSLSSDSLFSFFLSFLSFISHLCVCVCV